MTWKKKVECYGAVLEDNVEIKQEVESFKRENEDLKARCNNY